MEETNPLVTTTSSASCPPLFTINSLVTNVNIAPNGTIATRLDVKVAAGAWFEYLTQKPAGTAGRSKTIRQVVTRVPFALTQSSRDPVRNTSKILVAQDLDLTDG